MVLEGVKMLAISDIFMIRGGSFGFDYNVKLLMTIVTLVIVIYDWRTKKRKDYIWVFLAGAIIWSLAELAMQLMGTRIMEIHLLFGLPIPLWLSAPLQGISEGAFMAIAGLFVTDRLIDGASWKINVEGKRAMIEIAAFIAFYIILTLVGRVFVEGFQVPNVGGDVPSRRTMFTLIPVIFTGIMVASGILFIATTKKDLRIRSVYMFLIMVLFATIFTVTSYANGTRWIEVGTLTNLARAPPLIEFGALAYDAVIEIAAMYVPFLSIPCFFRLIKSTQEAN